MAVARPLFLNVWRLFLEVNKPVAEVGSKIGGKVNANIETGVFQNACPIRMSYVLNYSGVPIPSKGKYAVVSGADDKSYMFRVNDMLAFLKETFGKPDIVIKSPQASNFSGKQGIIVFRGKGWSNATGHVTLWNGIICSDACHFLGSNENGTFVPDEASLWTLR